MIKKRRLFSQIKTKRIVWVLRHNEWTIRVSSYLESNLLKSYNDKFKKKPYKIYFPPLFSTKLSTLPRHFHHNILEIKVKLKIFYKELRSVRYDLDSTTGLLQ